MTSHDSRAGWDAGWRSLARKGVRVILEQRRTSRPGNPGRQSGGLGTVIVKRLSVLACALAVGALVSLLGLTGEGRAGEMTLGDCIAAALQSNRDIAGAREALAQARSGVAEAKSGFLPNLSMSGSYNFLEKTPTVALPTMTGGFENVEMDFTKDYGVELALSQPLYSGGRISGSYRMSKATQEIAQADLERRQAEVALSVITAFYSLILARESVVVAQEAIKTAEEFLRVVEARYKAGEASSFEVMRAEVEVSNLKPALIAARNAVALSELALKNAMGAKAGADLAFVGSFNTQEYDTDVPNAVRLALENRPELRAADAQGRIAADGLAVAKAGRLPTVALTATYDFAGDKLKLENDAWEKTYNGYLVMSLPIFDGFRTKSQIARSRSGIRQAEIARAGLEDGIELEVRSSMLGLEAAAEALRSQEKNVEVAGEGLKIANDRYLQGLATNLDVMDAQLALTRARNYRLQALHDLNLATASLKRAMGILLTDHGRAGQGQ